MAMYSAFLQYQLETTRILPQEERVLWRPEWWGHIFMILHRIDDTPATLLRPPSEGIREVDCLRRPCSLCDAGMGGYQFRWYSQYWAKHYNQMRRPGAWLAPEPDPPTRRNASLRFWMQRETS